MSLANPSLINNPLNKSLYVDDYDYFAAPTPPASEEMITQDGEIMLTQDGEIMVTEGN